LYARPSPTVADDSGDGLLLVRGLVGWINALFHWVSSYADGPSSDIAGTAAQEFIAHFAAESAMLGEAH
jgi:hypothetical protein